MEVFIGFPAPLDKPEYLFYSMRALDALTYYTADMNLQCKDRLCGASRHMLRRLQAALGYIGDTSRQRSVASTPRSVEAESPLPPARNLVCGARYIKN